MDSPEDVNKNETTTVVCRTWQTRTISNYNTRCCLNDNYYRTIWVSTMLRAGPAAGLARWGCGDLTMLQKKFPFVHDPDARRSIAQGPSSPSFSFPQPGTERAVGRRCGFVGASVDTGVLRLSGGGGTPWSRASDARHRRRRGANGLAVDQVWRRRYTLLRLGV